MNVKSLGTKVLMSALLGSLSFFSVVSNGSILALYWRFKSLRTVQNILIASLALVDLLSSLINMPLFLIYHVVEASWMRGKITADIVSFLQLSMVVNNCFSMIAALADRYIALSMEFRYHAWKTNKKAAQITAGLWLLGLAITVSIRHFSGDVDLGHADMREYRSEMFKARSKYVGVVFGLFVLCFAVLGVLTVLIIRRRKRQRKVLNLPPLQAEARLRMDFKATVTIVITILAFCACYIPTIVFAASGYNGKDQLTGVWIGFLVPYSLFISSGLNPIVYAVRTRRYRLALRQLIKDPCGTGDFQEKERHSNAAVKRQDRSAEHEKAMGSRPAEADGDIEERVSRGRVGKIGTPSKTTKIHTSDLKKDGDPNERNSDSVEQSISDEINTFLANYCPKEGHNEEILGGRPVEVDEKLQKSGHSKNEERKSDEGLKRQDKSVKHEKDMVSTREDDRNTKERASGRRVGKTNRASVTPEMNTSDLKKDGDPHERNSDSVEQSISDEINTFLANYCPNEEILGERPVEVDEKLQKSEHSKNEERKSDESLKRQDKSVKHEKDMVSTREDDGNTKERASGRRVGKTNRASVTPEMNTSDLKKDGDHHERNIDSGESINNEIDIYLAGDCHYEGHNDEMLGGRPVELDEKLQNPAGHNKNEGNRAKRLKGTERPTFKTKAVSKCFVTESTTHDAPSSGIRIAKDGPKEQRSLGKELFGSKNRIETTDRIQTMHDQQNKKPPLM